MDARAECQALWTDTATHYNCTQSVALPFCERYGVDKESTRKLGTHFGGGMRCGGVCGAVSGALMVLSMAGCGEAEVHQFLERYQTRYGALTCAELLQRVGQGGKVTCAPLVYGAVELLEELLPPQTPKETL